MKCPRCHIELNSRSIQDIEIDECRDCQGIWLDAEKLRRLKDGADPDLQWMDFELWDHANRFHLAEKPIECPTCATALVAIEYGDTGVEIDYCTDCRGVWLDADEFSKIIARLSEDEEDALGVHFVLFTELLCTSDVVSLHVPLDETTRNLIGVAELSMMKPSAVLKSALPNMPSSAGGSDSNTWS